MKTVFLACVRPGGRGRVLDALLLFAVGSLASAQPVFTVQPKSRTVAEDTHFYLQAYANTGNLDWYHGAQRLPTQYSVNYAIPSARFDDAGDYYQVACNSFGCSTSAVAHITVVPGGALSQWERTWPDGVTAPLGIAAYGNGHYVTAVSDWGNADIVVSDDAIQWGNSGADFGLYYGGLVFAQGQFVLAGGEDNGPGTVLTSSNSHDWDTAFVDSHWDYFYDLHFDHGIFAMIGSAEDAIPALLRSTNAHDWVQVPQAFNRLAVSRGLWLGLARNHYPDYDVAISTNALDWTNMTATGLRDDYLMGLIGGLDKFLAFGSYWLASSEDGVTWTKANLPQLAANPAFIRSVTYGTNGYVGIVSGFCEPGLCFYPYLHTINSPDGVNWTLHPFAVDTDVGTLSFVNGLYILGGSQGVIFTSPDGLNWTQRAGYSTRQLHGMAGHSSGAVAVGERGLILTSSDGASWTRRDGVTRDDIYAIHFQGGRYVAAGGSGRSLLAESSDGQEWSLWTNSTGGGLRGITGDGVSVVAVGLRGTVVKSSGSSWNLYQANGSPDFRGVTLLNGRYVAIAYPEPVGYPPPPTPGAIFTSENGQDDWTLRATNQFAFYGIATGNGRVVVVGANGTVLVSTNGITWTPSDIGLFEHILCVHFAHGHFIAGARDGNILSSENGVDWIGHDLGLQPYYYAQPVIGWIGDAFNRVFAGGSYEEMWRSGLSGPELKMVGVDRNQGALRCTIDGLQGSTVRIQHSVDLHSWLDWGSYTNLSPSQILALPLSPEDSRRFYRAVEP